MCIDWKLINFDWNKAKAFLASAELGSLSAAAKALNCSQPTLSRQIASLEKELKVALFERVGKGLELTPNGVELHEYVKEMGNAASTFSRVATGKAESIAGNVCISASELIATSELPSIISKLREIEPKISIELIASSATSDLQRREADIALRSYRPIQQDLIAKKIREDDYFLYASKQYLKSKGSPKTIEAFNKADFIGLPDSRQIISMLNQRGLNLTQDNFSLTSSNHTVYWELLKKGGGIGFIPASLGRSENSVEKVLHQLGAFSTELWLVTHRELRTNRRIRFVFDFLSNEIANN